jgi:leucyl-tRNA synthetase
VNGKMRGDIIVKKDATREDIETEARRVVIKWLDSSGPIKVIYVPGRLINFVVTA